MSKTYLVTFTRLASLGIPAPFRVTGSSAEELAALIERQARARLLSQGIEVFVDLERGTGRVTAGFHTAGKFTITKVQDEPETPVNPPLPVYKRPMIAIDADCPACGKPERALDPSTGIYHCSSLGGGPCGYTSTERNR